MKAALIVILILAVGVAAYFLGKNGLSISVTTSSSPTPVATSVVSTPAPTPLASPIDENQILLNSMKDQLITEHGPNMADAIFAVTKIQGDYADGTAGQSGGGGMWFAVKVNGSWKLVWDGNGTIDCQTLVPFPNFPSSMISECWDSKNLKSVTR